MRLFIGLDCLADFEAGAEAALGMSARAFRELHGEALLWKWLERSVDFYQRLDWRADGDALWQLVNDASAWPGVPPMILATIPPGSWADPQRRAWCVAQLGVGVPVMTCEPQDRAGYCCAGDILIDCSDRGRLDWEEAGGVFVLHVSAAESAAALRELVSQPQREGTPT